MDKELTAKIKITQSMSNKNKSVRQPREFPQNTNEESAPLGIVLHSIGAANPNAQKIAEQFNRETREAAVHAILQPGEVLQCLPWSFRGVHTGREVNQMYLGVEMTEPDTIFYKNADNWVYNSKKTPKDEKGAITEIGMTEIIEKTTDFMIKQYDTAVILFAMLCNLYDLNPADEIEIKIPGMAPEISSLKSYVVTSHAESLMLGKNYCEERLIKCAGTYDGKNEYCTRGIVKCSKDIEKASFDQLERFCNDGLVKCIGDYKGKTSEYCDESFFICKKNRTSAFCEIARRNCGVNNFDWTYCSSRTAPCGKKDVNTQNGIRKCAQRVAMCGVNPKTCENRKTACGKSPEINPLSPLNVCGVQLRRGCGREYNNCSFNGKKEVTDKPNGNRCSGTNHGDPTHIWKRLNQYHGSEKRLTMDGFRQDIAEAMKTTKIYYLMEIESRSDMDVILGKKLGQVLVKETGKKQKAPSTEIPEYKKGYHAAFNDYEMAKEEALELSIAEAESTGGAPTKRYAVCFYEGADVMSFDPETQKLFKEDSKKGTITEINASDAVTTKSGATPSPLPYMIPGSIPYGVKPGICDRWHMYR
ncbi:MAG: peptidoglycan recognition protein family protein [Oscillospiraceae bacterium]|jgi:hypothetical protein|nr:peptidoglycan recognition protein family protein [Oscillospiraceae bacterium]